MRWKAYFENDRGLSELAEEFDDDPEILEDGDGFYIQSGRFEDLDDPNEVRDEANNIAQIIRSMGDLNSLRATDMEIRYVLDEKENHGYMQSEPAKLHISSGGTKITEISEDGTETVIHSPAKGTEERIQLALQDEKVEELSSLLARERTWGNMTKIYEFCEDNMDNGDHPVGEDWISRSKWDLLSHTANSRGAIGDESRHGCEGEPPPEPMSHNEAKRLIENVVDHWLDYRRERT